MNVTIYYNILILNVSTSNFESVVQAYLYLKGRTSASAYNIHVSNGSLKAPPTSAFAFGN